MPLLLEGDRYVVLHLSTRPELYSSIIIYRAVIGNSGKANMPCTGARHWQSRETIRDF